MKEYTITMTSKGQFTMPTEVRRSLGLSDSVNKLKLVYNPETKQARIEKPMTFAEIRAIAQKYIKPGTKPLLDARKFYEQREGKR
jgi:bifunctional DNA-binding transcriptional regulator/antitoxin component of YhaV-PrlF toxin-antitoxin module